MVQTAMPLFLEWMRVSFDSLLANVRSPEWWAGELPSWLFFTFIVGAIASYFEARRDRKDREPYEGWTLQVVGYGDKPQSLYFEDVRRHLNSDFEMFRFLKSVCTTICKIKTKSLADARRDWFFIDTEARVMTVDLLKIPDSEVEFQIEKPKDRPIVVAGSVRPGATE